MLYCHLFNIHFEHLLCPICICHICIARYGIFQARILEWSPFPSPGDPPDPQMEPMSLTSPALAPPGKPNS